MWEFVSSFRGFLVFNGYSLSQFSLVPSHIMLSTTIGIIYPSISSRTNPKPFHFNSISFERLVGCSGLVGSVSYTHYTQHNIWEECQLPTDQGIINYILWTLKTHIYASNWFSIPIWVSSTKCFERMVVEWKDVECVTRVMIHDSWMYMMYSLQYPIQDMITI